MKKVVYWGVALGSGVAPLMVGLSALEWAPIWAEHFKAALESHDALPSLSRVVILQPSVPSGAMFALSVAVLIAHVLVAWRIKNEANRLLAWGVISAFGWSGAYVCAGSMIMGYGMPALKIL